MLLHGDCLELMKQIPDGSVDMILTDPPYGTTACKWDNVIPFEPMWEQIWRVLKPNGVCLLFGCQPFFSFLVSSQAKLFRYELIWDKVNLYTNYLNSNKQPLRRHENIGVFYKKQPIYNKQFRSGKAYKTTKSKKNCGHEVYGKQKNHESSNDGKSHNPCTLIEIRGDVKKEKGLHPTQKPVALLEYLIKTYTLEGETVLDFTMGSGSTGVACMNTGRKFIGIEMDDKYFEIAQKRIAGAKQ